MKTSFNGALIKKAPRAIAFLGLFVLIFRPASGQVVVKVDSMSIPTYLAGQPDPMPRFDDHTSHQGVRRRLYPHPFDDNLTDNKVDKKYLVVDLSNKYIDIGITPEIGGRIFYAYDKVNNYDWIYRQHVIKPYLIGMEGWWISGGLAWGFPHHHGPNICEPLSYKIVNNPDSSVTVWFDNIDQLDRMRALVGFTVYPRSSQVEMTIRLWNRTDLAHSFLFWTVPAVHADTNYQVIFPPSVQYVTFHGKVYMTTWPIADGVYNGYDFKGVDVSMWKNTAIPTSFFAWDEKEDYFGGYNHGKKAGTVWVGNHYTQPGMKYWADGNNAAGRWINNHLTDDDGQYIEQMSGVFSDNQPDYSWLQPFETKNETMVWFPIRDLDGLKYANRNGALNLGVSKNNIIQLRINTTSPYDQAKVVLKSRGETVLEKTIDINPAKSFSIDLPAQPGIKEDDLTVALLGANGETVLSYAPSEHHPPKYPKPDVNRQFPSPDKIKTVEELYLDGLWIYQFHNLGDPMPYFREALKRDPGNSSVNTQLGIMEMQDFKWTEAEKHFRTALTRVTSHYVSPRDGEAVYYYGLALKATGRIDSAYDCFYKASWSAAFNSSAFYQLARIDCIRGEYEKALDHLDRAIVTNAHNEDALVLKATVLRHMNNVKDAEQIASSVQTFDVMNHGALYELYLLHAVADGPQESSGRLNEFTSIMKDNVQSYLELAIDYGSCSFYKDAISVLTRLEQRGNQFPMLYYYLGYYWSREGDMDRALSYYRTASTKPYTYCFPFRAESIPVLQAASASNPGDAKAPYYLGNLLYEHQPENAIKEWEKSLKIDDSFYICHRNLGLAYAEVRHDYARALSSMNKAVACNGDEPRLLFELDQLNGFNNVPPEKAYGVLKQHEVVAGKRSETILRLATRAVQCGKYDEALDILANNFIEESEGARERLNTYLNAHTLRAMGYIEKKDYAKARRDLDSALAYPIGLYGRSLYAQLYYLDGVICQNLGKTEEAESFFQKALGVQFTSEGSDREYLYYRGLALQKLGKFAEARELFTLMLKEAQGKGAADVFSGQFGSEEAPQIEQARTHFMAGLAYEGLGDKAKARVEFTRALKLDPSHVWARANLKSM